MVTSAKSRGGRVAVPAKMTSSIPPPRSDLGLPSPITQRIASNRLDLPQPLGPTTPVSPGSILSSAGSTKLLNPLSLSRRIFNFGFPAPSYDPIAARSLGSSASQFEPSTSDPLIRKAGVPGTLNCEMASVCICTNLVVAASSARQAALLADGTPRIAAHCGKPASLA